MRPAGVRYQIGAHPGAQPYLVAGGGVAFSRGASIRQGIAGQYALATPQGATIAETDAVTVVFQEGAVSLVGFAGGGVSHPLSKRTGFRVDGRIYLEQDRANTLVSTSAGHLSVPPTGSLTVQGPAIGPSLQFSSSPALKSSLSGPNLAGFKTLAGGGFNLVLAIEAVFYFKL